MTSGESLLRGKCTKPLLDLHQIIAPCEFLSRGLFDLIFIFLIEKFGMLFRCACADECAQDECVIKIMMCKQRYFIAFQRVAHSLLTLRVSINEITINQSGLLPCLQVKAQ